MKRDLAIYGAGGFGRETALMIEQINQVTPSWNLIGFYDDGLEKDILVDGYPILGAMADLKKMKTSPALTIAIADPLSRMNITNQLSDLRLHFPILIHPQAITGSTINSIGQGSIITAGCIFTTGIEIGKFCIVNLSTTLGHDVQMGDYTTLMPGCSISGNVNLGKSCMVGTGVRILQNLSLGAHCKIGAGAVVINSFGDSSTLVGVPAKPINKR